MLPAEKRIDNLCQSSSPTKTETGGVAIKNHVWRPLFVVAAVVALIVAVRVAYVPSDFGAHERGYMYGWHRKSNENEWKAVTVKYRTAEYCRQCHAEHYGNIKESAHAGISCENCHGPALGHPEDPRTLFIDRSRELCVRCHLRLPYHASRRGSLKGIDPREHYTQAECVMCHNPHSPKPWRQEEER